MLEVDFNQIERRLFRALPEMSVIYQFLEFLASCLIVFGGVVPYVPQYLEIRSTRNADGFSTFVCLTLLVANTLRILFWFGHPFELPLLTQSIIMNVTMFAMVHLCVSVRQKTDFPGRQRQFSDFKLDEIWRWTDFTSYVQFMVLFTVVASCFTAVLVGFPIYVEALGLCSVLAEAMLGMPQFYRNFQNKSTEGMSVKMVLMWMCGDVYKTMYFIFRHAPLQFPLCGALQILLDVAILYQVLLYSSPTSAAHTSTHHRSSPTSFLGVSTR